MLGANEGIVSTSSLILGVAAAHAGHSSIVLSGIAGLVAGGMSMAIGEYVSVHSQADSEAAALAQEREELKDDPAGERRELTEICVRRGLEGAPYPAGGGAIDGARRPRRARARRLQLLRPLDRTAAAGTGGVRGKHLQAPLFLY